VTSLSALRLHSLIRSPLIVIRLSTGQFLAHDPPDLTSCEAEHRFCPVKASSVPITVGLQSQ
jgi:hypothetical protein